MTNAEALQQVDEAQTSVMRTVAMLRDLMHACQMLGLATLTTKLSIAVNDLSKSHRQTHEAMSHLVANMVKNASASEKAILEGIIQGVIRARGP